jgi:hypothetical protein
VTWTTERRSLIEQEIHTPAGTTVASVRAEALRSPRDALAALAHAKRVVRGPLSGDSTQRSTPTMRIS